ncbi:hypothetical protein P7C73_g5835, partial [Tremellales sp. Uapishka_1]
MLRPSLASLAALLLAAVAFLSPPINGMPVSRELEIKHKDTNAHGEISAMSNDFHSIEEPLHLEIGSVIDILAVLESRQSDEEIDELATSSSSSSSISSGGSRGASSASGGRTSSGSSSSGSSSSSSGSGAASKPASGSSGAGKTTSSGSGSSSSSGTGKTTSPGTVTKPIIVNQQGSSASAPSLDTSSGLEAAPQPQRAES